MVRIGVDHEAENHVVENGIVSVSAKVDYALRAAAELAAAEGQGPVKGEQLARTQAIPLKFLENILLELRHAGLVQSQRGVEGGYWLARPAAEITLADVIRAVEGPLANVRGTRPESVEYQGPPNRFGRSGSPSGPACAACSSRSRSPTSRAASCPTHWTTSSPTPRPGGPIEPGRLRNEDDLARSRARAPRSSSRVSWAENACPSRVDQVDAHLEAEVDDPGDHGLERPGGARRARGRGRAAGPSRAASRRPARRTP